MDESKVNKRSELEICCNISSASGVESRHYKCVDLQAGDAETICNTLIGEMVAYGGQGSGSNVKKKRLGPS